MALTPAERKYRMPYGEAKKIARRRRVNQAYITRAMAGQIFPKSKRAKDKLRRVQVDIALAMGLPLEVAWGADELALSGSPDEAGERIPQSA